MNRPEYSLTDLSPPQTARIPGDLAMWCFILAELLAFLLLLGSMAFARGHWEQMFSAGIATLHPEAGLINTLILLSGSYFAARGVRLSAQGQPRALGRGFSLAALCGLGYVAIKLSEYALLFGAGYNLRTDTFYFFYFFTTFFHMAHVLIGMVILLVVARRYRTGQYPNADKARMAGESAASYW
ncbi:MAG: cytochrome c oxidase subunit 3 family protein, partial [Pseudomonas formosensis]|nr:cytochrome c oxidase subunit 3 family protein [Halopseudomonas formosensis]